MRYILALILTTTSCSLFTEPKPYAQPCKVYPIYNDSNVVIGYKIQKEFYCVVDSSTLK